MKRRKCKVIYNLIDFDNIDRQSNNETDNNRIKKNNTLTIIVAANHRYLKNLDGLIEDYKAARKGRAKRRLKLIGMETQLTNHLRMQ
ncbi:MAG: glycosyltransferase [Chloroflexia bacterium]|nr:glycosyltransferase [Chloroflexia bacterium]